MIKNAGHGPIEIFIYNFITFTTNLRFRFKKRQICVYTFKIADMTYIRNVRYVLVQ